MSEQTGVLVIGGGVIGVCAAYYLAERGRRVTLVERGEIAAGSSYGNAGVISPSHSTPLATPKAVSQGVRWLLDPESPFYIKPRLDPGLFAWLWQFRAAARESRVRAAIPVLRDLGFASLRLFDELAMLDGLDYGYQRNGAMILFKTRAGFDGGVEEANVLSRFGIELQVLDAEGVREVVPSVKPGVVGGLFFPADGHLIPADFVRGVARLAEKKGASILTRTEVLGFETSGRGVTAVRTSRGDFQPEQVVLAAGAWSPRLAGALRLHLPIQPGKGYSITFRSPADVPPVPVLLGEVKVAVTPMGSALRFAGTLELAGLDLSISQRRVDAVARGARRYLTGLDDLETIETWCGLRPCTPDGLPIIGLAPSFSNLIVATGHATGGMALGPITGKVVAQLACGEPTAVDLSLFQAERFLS